ncbi:succinyl-CoA synthetase alpha subunit [Vibrio sp. ES.051]|uniref:acyl-CoA synthetase FdrA n=1 Tax=Vibrio sp. ES.051 TaxID=1761909 RepID=UPI000BF7A622|nr:acyl-CoA synthetase FdrA [Vibrio sp. ES.051]PFG56291.1 succinyl-CoA synthetase alpha subunit [Vibrio sp. ES.051]
MTVKYKAFENMYQDSVSLMQLSAQLNKLDGIEDASVVMGTEANLSRMADAGFGSDISAKPNDLVIAVKGEEAACDEAIALAEEQLTSHSHEASSKSDFVQPLTSFALGLEQNPDANLALISVPGEYAAAEAIKALNLGLNVMMFSDNVPLQDELKIKQLAQKKNLIVMGPDCGTAIINGTPLGFANVVRQGEIGIVAASGTGLQEATCRVHQLGAGISQALGTGGHDLHQEVGGISMLTGLQALIEDEQTRVIVLISKPPAQEIAERIIKVAQSTVKPVVVHFLGASDEHIQRDGVYSAETLAHSAEVAVALLNEQTVNAPESIPPTTKSTVLAHAEALNAEQRYVRGVFAGGTFCFEAQLICDKADITGYSNTPVTAYHSLNNIWESQGHTIVDLGDDEFTQGRPHPMIDPTLRNQRIIQEARDPQTAVVLFDVVLGYGASEQPLDELIAVIEGLKKEQDQLPVFIAHVCGTDSDPQSRELISQMLTEQGVIIADCNAQAAEFATLIINQQNQ